MSKTNNARWRFMLKYLGINNSHVAKETGLDYTTVRRATSTAGKFSRWAKFTLWVFDEMLKKINEK